MSQVNEFCGVTANNEMSQHEGTLICVELDVIYNIREKYAELEGCREHRAAADLHNQVAVMLF